MLTKDQVEIMQLFVSKIAKSFTMRGVASALGKDPAQIHRAIQPLLKKGLLLLTEEKRVRLNYAAHYQELAYAEHLRTEKFLGLPRNRSLQLFVDDVLKKIKDEYFIMLLFGSAVEKEQPRDIDVLVIVDSPEKIEFTERFMENVADRATFKLDINVVPTESVYEMATRREEVNVLNELLNKHLILYGGESFYRLLHHARR